MEIFVPDYEWNAHYTSVEQAVCLGQACGDYDEGTEFKMVRLTVGACTTYRISDGKPVPLVVAFPEGLPDNVEVRGASRLYGEASSGEAATSTAGLGAGGEE